MNIILAQVEPMLEALNRIGMQSLPGRITYQLNKIVRQLREEQQGLNQAKQGIIDRLGAPSDTPGIFVAKQGCEQEWHDEIAQLSTTEVELKMSLDERILDVASFTQQDLVTLEPLIAFTR